jgi:flagellar biosynthesis chaperone FliJ
VTRKYPLDPLKRVRAETVDQRARALSRALGNLEATRAELDRRERAKREVERSLSEVKRAEREKLENGELSVADLARGAAFDIGGEIRRVACERAEDNARLGHARAIAEAEDKRKTLGSARADADVVEKHHERWRAARQVEEIAKEEESAEEAYLARPKARGRA